jgi:hypothetical protein
MPKGLGFFGFRCGFLQVVQVYKPAWVTVTGMPTNDDKNQYFYVDKVYYSPHVMCQWHISLDLSRF